MTISIRSDLYGIFAWAVPCANPSVPRELNVAQGGQLLRIIAIVVASFILLMACARSVVAQTQEQAEKCVSGAVAGCTALIESGTLRADQMGSAFADRCDAYRSGGDNDRALADCEEAIRLDPKSAKAFNYRCDLYLAKEDNERALADCNEAIRLDPNYSRAYNHRGAAHLGMRKYDDAIADFSEAIRLDGKAWWYFADRCWARTLSGHDLSLAIQDCDQALRMQPDSFDALNSRGLAHLKIGAYEAARDDYDAATKLRTRDANSLYGRGFAAQRAGDAIAGARDMLLAEGLNPGIREVFADYGVK